MFMNPYSLILWLRHKCYDWRICKSVQLDIPTLSIGNITVGGTGKTPHTELILRLFSQEIPIAVLSRGYKRTSKGFRYVYPTDSVLDVGDEPLQIKRKFPSVVVAVDKNRIAGIKRIEKEFPQIKLIVLDDAFQYRRLKPTYSILLSDYHRPYTTDSLLPFGRLRDLPSQAKRANMIIVTKSPPAISSTARENQCQLLKPKSTQLLLFSSYTYGAPLPLFPEAIPPAALPPQSPFIALTAIAQPNPFLDHINKSGLLLKHLNFPDHHHFVQKDVTLINEAVAQNPHTPIYTTEKDAMRLLEATHLSMQAKAALYYIPLQVDLCTNDEENQFVEIVKKISALPPQLPHPLQ